MKKKIYEMTDHEFQEYLEEVRTALEDMTVEEALGFASHPIDPKQLGTWPTHQHEDATPED